MILSPSLTSLPSREGQKSALSDDLIRGDLPLSRGNEEVVDRGNK